MTFWESNDNYGQQLQCWALQHYLRSKGFDPFLIRARMFTAVSKKSRIKSFAKQIIRFFKEATANLIISCNGLQSDILSKLILEKFGKDWAYRRFNVFQRKYLKRSRIYNSYEDLLTSPPHADVYIAGSDQIWNSDLTNEVWKITFLQFGAPNIKRIAYAPSMSICNLDSEQELIFNRYLKSFASISAREDRTVKNCRELGYECELVIDPTILLSSLDYKEIEKSKHQTPYIFLYTINYETIDEIPSIGELRKIAKLPSCDVVVTTGGGYIKNDELLNDEVKYDYATIPEWIGNIRNAELVITPSFHGIVFSILFHRNFIFTPLKGRYSTGNERVFDLLNHLGIQGHVWGQSDVNCCIDWCNVDVRLSQLRTNSMTYLLNAIEKK